MKNLNDYQKFDLSKELQQEVIGGKGLVVIMPLMDSDETIKAKVKVNKRGKLIIKGKVDGERFRIKMNVDLNAGDIAVDTPLGRACLATNDIDSFRRVTE